jgi:hypothetical protein
MNAQVSPALQRFFSTAPDWQVEVRPDDFTNYSCEEVLHGVLCGSRLRAITLFVEHDGLGGPPGAREEEGWETTGELAAELAGELASELQLADTLDAELDPSFWEGGRETAEVRLVVSADHGAWLVGWGGGRGLRDACDELAWGRRLLTARLVRERGWHPDEIPLGVVIVATHHARSEVSAPPGFEDVAIMGKEELPRLASRLVEVPTRGAGPLDPSVALRLVGDLFVLGDVVGHEECVDFPPELPEWMVRERDASG